MIAFDFHIVLSIVGVAFAGGIIGLDRTAAGQFMVSQPIVAGPITGWMLGDVTTGLVIGAVLELIWVLDVPVGTFVPADASIGAVSATAIAILGSGGTALPDVIGFSILLTTAIVPLTMMIDVIARKKNSGLVEYALAPGEVVSRKLALAHLSGLVVFFMKSFILYLIVLPAGLAALLLFARMPTQFHSAMALFVKLLPLLGVALVARKLSIRTLDLFLLMGFVTATVFTQFIHVPALSVSGLVIIAGLLGVRLSER
ncbi:MAG TPA: PTS sugar transporter subunit IIC [Nitrospirota bacterium]|nr:PTS sugar transporter subunit IIC [Nitrospirota bacterium]